MDHNYLYNLGLMMSEVIQNAYGTKYGISINSISKIMSDLLNKRETEVIILRYRDDKSFREIGTELSVSGSYANQVYKKAMHKLLYLPYLEKYMCILDSSFQTYKREMEWKLGTQERLINAMKKYGKFPDWFAEEIGLIPMTAQNREIEELDFTVRTFHCLQRANIRRVSQLLCMSENDFMAVRNFGQRCLNEVIDKIHSIGLKMQWEEEV